MEVPRRCCPFSPWLLCAPQNPSVPANLVGVTPSLRAGGIGLHWVSGGFPDGPGLSFAVEKWQALYSLLEAFGNSPTIMNGNATRFSQILSLDFDQAGQVASASIQVRDLQGSKRSAAWIQALETRLSPVPHFPGILPQQNGPCL